MNTNKTILKAIVPLCAAFFFIFANAVTYAQEEPAVAEAQVPASYIRYQVSLDGQSANLRPRIIALLIGFDKQARFEESEKSLLMESLELKIQDAHGNYVLRNAFLLGIPEATDLLASAQLMGADAYLHIVVAGSMELATIKAQYQDISNKNLLATTELSAKIDSRFRNAFGGLWQQIAAMLVPFSQRISDAAAVTVRAPAGTRVLAGSLDAIVDQSGGLVMETPSGITLGVTIYQKGMQVERHLVFVDQKLELDYLGESVFPLSFDLGLHWLSFLAPAINLQLDDNWRLRLGFDLYVIGFVPSSPLSTDSSLIKDFKRISTYLDGHYLFGSASDLLRFRLGLGLGLNFYTGSNGGLDEISPVFFQIPLGLELNLSKNISFFAELVPMLTYSADPDLVLSALHYQNLTNNQTSISPGNIAAALGPFVFEPLHFRMGIRIQP